MRLKSHARSMRCVALSSTARDPVMHHDQDVLKIDPVHPHGMHGNFIGFLFSGVSGRASLGSC